jgi:hypothetical protein
MRLYIEQIPQTEQIVLAGDHTAWSRLDAITLKERTYEHQAQPMSGAKPVAVGQGYSTIAIIPETEGSWALPLLHERITSERKPDRKSCRTTKISLPKSTKSPIIPVGC